MEEKYIYIGIIAVVVIGIGALCFLMLGDNSDGFYSNLDEAYYHYEKVEGAINESKNYVSATSDDGIDRYISLNEKRQKELKLEKEYLNKAADGANSKQKEYIDLLIKLNEIDYETAEENIKISEIEKQYTAGKISYGEYSAKYDTYADKSSDLDSEWFSTLNKVSDFLMDNPEFESELESKTNVTSIYKGISPYTISWFDIEEYLANYNIQAVI